MGSADLDFAPPIPLAERLAWVRRFRSLVASEEASLRRLVSDELGKPEWEVLTSELMPLLAACRWVERRGARVFRSRAVGRTWWQPLERQRVERVPLGRVAIIATWNYPLQLLGIQMVEALAAGNRVVVKPSEHAPRSQDRLIRLMWEAGAPEGVLSATAPTREAGERLLAEESFDHVVFTGSTGVGREIARSMGERLTTTTLELSGRDSAFVLADADPVHAAREIFRAVGENGGQTCMAPRRVLVDRRIEPAFLAAIAPLASGARPRRLVNDEAANVAFGLARDAVARGGRSISGVLEAPVRGSWLRPLVIAGCPAGAPLVAGEHFGPVVAVVGVDSIDEALAVHHACDQHLATSVFTRRPSRGRSLASRLGATSVTINEVVRPTGNPGASIGGRGASGWGLTRGREGLLAMTRPVFVSVTPRRLRTPGDAGSARLLRVLSGVTRAMYGRARVAGTRGVHGAQERSVGPSDGVAVVARPAPRASVGSNGTLELEQSKP